MSGLEPPITIRPGCPTDAPHVHVLIQPFVQRGLLLDRTIEQIAFLATNSMAAECRGELIGFAAVEIYSKKLAEIQCMAVKSEYQNRGVGKLLVTGCVEIAARNKVLELMVITSSDEFLKTCGFDYSLPGQKKALFINP